MRSGGASLDHFGGTQQTMGARQDRLSWLSAAFALGIQPVNRLNDPTSVYQLVRENQQVWRNFETELFSGFQIDDEIKFIGVSDGQVSGFCAFQDFTHKTHCYLKALLGVSRVAHQAAAQHVPTTGTHGRNFVSFCQPHDLIRIITEKRYSTDV